MLRKLVAELIGTFWLVLGGCGSAVLAANFGGDGNPLGIGLLGVSLAFARRHSDTIEEVSDFASVSRYGESAGKSRISRRWASANAWYGIVGKM